MSDHRSSCPRIELPELGSGPIQEPTATAAPVRVWETSLDAAGADRMLEQAALAPSPYTEYLRYSVAARKLTPLLPDSLLTLLTLFRTHPQAPGALVIKGLPIDPDLCPTPRDGGRAPKAHFVSEAMLGAI